MPECLPLLWILASYGLGCFTAGYYVTSWSSGQDLRVCGSGTLGARNAGRLLGARGFLVVFLLDFAKGAAAVGVSQCLGLNDRATAACMIAVVMGHLWPVQLHFHGGKGVSTTLGVLAVGAPLLGVTLAAVFLLLLAATRLFTLSGLLAFALLPLTAWLMHAEWTLTLATVILTLLILWAHRAELRTAISTVRQSAMRFRRMNRVDR